MVSKIERIGINLLQEDKETLRELARAEGEAMSVIVRRLIRERGRELAMERLSQPAPASQGSKQEAMP